MTEADKPRPLAEHLGRAHGAWEKIAEFARKLKDDPEMPGQLVTLRESAAKGFWLYPLVEARRGVPG